ncbi:tetratricopeptide repeat protein [candidate division KSB1 bacterium]|nr:tetratricopeptide repeat protein [candidate division KSB1 bacterium]
MNLLFLLLVLSGTNCIVGASQPDSLILYGIDQSIRQNYASAESTFTRLINESPEHPRGYFFLAATLQSKSMDFETDIWEDEFILTLDKAENRARKLLRINDEDEWARFYLGSALSYRAFYDGKKNRFVSAIKRGLAGISELNKVIAIDSTMYDAYLGIGSYKYWRSKFTRYLDWLPLIKDERELGIKMVKLAAEKGTYTKYAAINALVWILIDHGDVSEALKWVLKGLSKYPQSRFFLWGAAKTYFNLQQYDNAIKYYQNILGTVQQEKLNNHYNEIICYYKIAECHFKLQQHDQAALTLEKIRSFEIESKIRDRLKDIYSKSEELQKKLDALGSNK